MSTTENQTIDFSALRSAVSGVVLARGDDGFAEEAAGFNLAVQHDPDVIVGVVSDDDVVAAVRFAAAHHLPLRVQATGHGAFAPLRSGMLICTRRLDTLEIDAERRLARIGAGVRWDAVIAQAAPFGLAPIIGSTPDVSAVGYTLGGGIGPLVRSHGATVDWVRGFRVVTGTGEVVSVSADEHPDLFWALCGGKVGLGVVTEMTVELAQLATLYGGGLMFDADAAPAALRAWATWAATLPEEATTSTALLRMPDAPMIPEPLRGRKLLHVRFAYPGDEAEGARLLQPMRDAAPVYMDHVTTIPYAAIASIHQDPTDPAPAWVAGAMLSRFDRELADVVLDHFGPDADSPFLSTEVRQLGGKLVGAAGVESAVGGRDAQFVLNFIAVGPLAFQPEVPQGIADAFFGSISGWRSPITNINFAGDPYLPQIVAEAWLADVEERLTGVRSVYDPDRVLA